MINNLNIEKFNTLINSGLNKLYSLDENSNLLFQVKKTIISNNKIKGIIYTVNPDYDVYILTADKYGNVKENKILEYSIHFNLKGYEFDLTDYSIYKSKADFKFNVSNDHSLLVYDIEDKRILKMKPENFVRNKKRYGLVALKSHFTDNIPQINDKLVYIPQTYLKYKRVKDITMYDISVEDTNYDNFFLANGICVVDTVVVYALHTEEAKQEALEKMAPSKQFIDPSNHNSYIFDVDKNIVFGLVIGSHEAKDFELSYKAKTFKLKTDVNNYNELLERLKGTNFTIFDYIILPNNEKYTIGQYLIKLALDKIK